LTYKPGTDTLRRSLAVELCDWLLEQGAFVHVHDPAVEHLPEPWVGRVFNHKLALEALAKADVLVIGTECPEFREKASELASVAKPHLVVIDANRHLQVALANSDIKYLAVGMPSSKRDK
jgi:UDPglucose 6-dehydrogenase